MAVFLLRRVAQSLIVLLVISLLAFAFVQAIPGDPARLALGPRASDAAVSALQQDFRLDQPVLSQYWHFVTGAVQLDFGDSIRSRQPVGSLVGSRIAPTVLLLGYSAVLSLLLALVLGVFSATRAGRPADAGIQVTGMFLVAMPQFWLALILILVFGVNLGVFATSGYDASPLGVLRTLTLPAITITCGLAPALIRSVRASVLENLSADYATAARSRGLPRRRVLVRHVLRNSVISTVTILGSALAFLVSGTVVVEAVFGIPGLGSLSVDAVANRDFPVVQTLVLLFGTLTLIANLATDVAYGFLDPRVRL